MIFRSIFAYELLKIRHKNRPATKSTTKHPYKSNGGSTAHKVNRTGS